MENKETIGLIKQRLEILWQLVESLETGGGGGGTSDYSELSNKPQINSTILEGNKTAAQLGLATSTSVSGLTERFEDLFALDNVSLENNQEYPTSIESLLALHEPLNINNVNYYFFEESGIDYSYFAIDTSGAFPKISYAQFLKDSHRVVFYDFATDTVPTQNSDNFITSGGVNTALGDFYTKTEVNTTLGNYYNKTEVDSKDGAVVDNDGVKNLLILNPPSTSSGGVSLTVNTDGTITSTGGTSSSAAAFQLNTITLPAGDYILSGCPSGGSDNTYRLDISGTQSYDIGSGVQFTSTGTAITIRIRIGANTSVDNFVWKPMVRKASITNGDFVSYAPNNHELWEMIKALQPTVNNSLRTLNSPEEVIEEEELTEKRDDTNGDNR